MGLENEILPFPGEPFGVLVRKSKSNFLFLFAWNSAKDKIVTIDI